MIQRLYETFKMWSSTGSVYIISDPHFDDEDTKLMNSNWITPQEHLDKINKTVTKNDTLICLGDCGNLDWVRRINAGYKVLIKGNHDDHGNSYYEQGSITEEYDKNNFSKKELLKLLEEKYPYHHIFIYELNHSFHARIRNMLFDEVYSGPLFISDKILLSHEPVYGLSFCLNIHGHVHNGEYKYNDNWECKHINLASDVVNFELFNLGSEIKSGILSDIKDIHRLTIDNAIMNPVHNKQ